MGLSHFFITYFTVLQYTRRSMNQSFPGATPSVFMSVGKAMLRDESDKPLPSAPLTPALPDPPSDVLSGNKVGVDIEPETVGNKVNIQLCNLSLVFSCFSREKKNV